MSSQRRRHAAKRVVLDDARLDQESSRCQNRKCGDAADVVVVVDADLGSYDVPLCRHCAQLLVAQAAPRGLRRKRPPLGEGDRTRPGRV